MTKKIYEGVHWVKVLNHWTRYSTMEVAAVGDDDETNKEPINSKTIVMIPGLFFVLYNEIFGFSGNPGNDLFYKTFGYILVEALAKKYPNDSIRMYTIAHLNHVPILTDLASEPHVRFSLQDQIDQKMNFCMEYLRRRKNDEIYLVGHSIGALICLNIIPKLQKEGWNIVKCFALFPTLEQMVKTPNGKRINFMIQTFEKYDFLTKILTFWLNFIPRFLKQWLCNLNLGRATVMYGEQIPKCVKDAAVELLNMNVIRNILFMTKTEFDTVKDFDSSLLNDLQIFYYGIGDGWAPLEFAERMRERVSDKSQVIVDEMKCEHAFVIHGSEKMALKLADFI